MQVWLSQTAQQPITEASLILCRFLQSNLRPARCETPAAQTRRTGYITHDAVRFFRSRSCRCGARVRGSFMWILAELDGQGPSSSARPAARLSAVCAHIQYRSTCWLLQSVCTASNPPLLLFLTPLPPSVAHLFSPSPSLCLSPHEILQYASKFPDADSLLSRFSFKASDFFFNRFYRRENHESLSADAAAVPSPPSPPLQTESQLFLGVLSFFQHDFKKLSVRIFAVWSLLLLFFLLLLLSLRASPIDAENLHQEDTDVDQDNIVY